MTGGREQIRAAYEQPLPCPRGTIHATRAGRLAASRSGHSLSKRPASGCNSGDKHPRLFACRGTSRLQPAKHAGLVHLRRRAMCRTPLKAALGLTSHHGPQKPRDVRGRTGHDLSHSGLK
jgi:hypothetical protein